MRHIQIWRCIFFCQKILKYFKDFKNQNFPVLSLEWTQTVEMKQNQTFLWNIFKSDIYVFFVRKYWSISMNFKIEISQFYD